MSAKSNGACPALPGSRAEALRQQIRDAQLTPPETEDSSNVTTAEKAEERPPPNTTPPRKVFNSRAEAEQHRQQTRERNPVGKGDVGAKQEENARPSGADAEETNIEGPDFNSKVTIDMILTVVAECYGQKDLLRYRDIWVE
jgi:hypothetical protein